MAGGSPNNITQIMKLDANKKFVSTVEAVTPLHIELYRNTRNREGLIQAIW